jgi:uncharacterized protein
MASLMNSEKKVLLTDLQIASWMWPRMKGLLGTQSLSASSGLWIHRTNSIHTFFMKYSIDCDFVNRKMEVKKLVRDVRPGRFVFPIMGATSVIELSAGTIDKLGLQVGDQLYVGA